MNRNRPSALTDQMAKTRKETWASEKPKEYSLLHDRDFVLSLYQEWGAEEASILCGIAYQTFYEYLKAHNIPLDRDNKRSAAEQEIESFIKDLGFHTEANNRTLLNGKEIDVYVPEKKVGIEYHGLRWHSTEFQISPSYHKYKQDKALEAGIVLIQVFEDEWREKKAIIKNRIRHLLGKTKGDIVYGRNTTINEVSYNEYRDLLESTHIQGPVPADISYGCMYEGELVAVMCFNQKENDIWEISRYSTRGSVVGGFSKLMSHFSKTHQPKEVFSFADRRWSDGNVYLVSGFEEISRTKPNYWYVMGKRRVGKGYFRHGGMKELAEKGDFIYDPSLSEKENTEANGLYRIYDAGLIKFSKTFSPC